ncbi:uncharacterized protein K460DRAFT_49520 [Cucurbitaria berberidis CBS 394.84]|uniref:Uncharacterized protein n=1 Tax=Cucurbitaria berberidis CBS 394.84 TaxID=1168544 RepID=A0A9P4L9Z1_9PLEO|nr:uncharacterized protein K460DRAFT_49520 [Cucurbitaria berberidis CBS 394.84]KAF1846878.1 hypothetical protein K460DRAFT_49520 [Cucurbitaria berberidis CBS 394.84]
MQLLPKHSFNWLKQLTIGAPFMGFALYLDEDELSDLGDGFDPPGTILGYKYNAEDFIQHRLVYGLVDVIATAPNLRTLNIVVPPDWNYHQCCTFYFDGDNDDDNNHVHIDNIGIWDAMAALLRLKPFLLVTVIDVYRPNNLDRHLLRHERFINQLKRRLGIWDIREAECRLDRDTIPDGMSTRNRGEWAMPTQSSREHPDEYLRYLAELFSGKL